MSANTWKSISERKLVERDGKIPTEWCIPSDKLPSASVRDVIPFARESGLFTARELEITESLATDIVTRITEGQWSSLEVTEAFCKRAAVAQQLLNCLSEPNFDAALARAKELDAYLAEHKKPIGPLHGLPISLKDQFRIKGLDATMGYAGQAFQPCTEESTLVQLLHEAGAVIHTKTNVPTTLMAGETVNNVFGRTVNPHNRENIPGGSSGGESALISFHGSPLGVGTDIGGSIRSPASFTGLWALRPSIGRVPYRGANNSFLGQEAIQSTAGPLCHSPADIRLFMQSLISTQPWLHDPGCLPIPWRSEAETLSEKLCFAVATGDDVADSLPPLRRAVALTREALERAGHRVIEWTWADRQCARARDIVIKMWSADGGEDVRRQLEVTGETLPEEIVVNPKGTPQTVFETWQNQYAAADFKAEFLAQWQATAAVTGTGRPIDGLIMPCTPFPAKPHGGRYPWFYTSLVPLLDVSSGVFPVTRVDQELDVPRAGYEPFGEIDKRVHDSYAGPEKYWNAPVGLQLIGRRLEEEKIVGMLSEIEKALKAADVHP
ncbi:unnamed protein product [Peniophora sp. CBMAI 1063]|nr:unnamed protein product [Peniophora sp. CBMAI 1063]